jgi:hypothetical protein
MERLCRVPVTDTSSKRELFEAVVHTVKLKGGHIATDGSRPIKVLVSEPKQDTR